jgi:hypothetical protein
MNEINKTQRLQVSYPPIAQGFVLVSWPWIKRPGQFNSIWNNLVRSTMCKCRQSLWRFQDGIKIKIKLCNNKQNYVVKIVSDDIR